MILLGMLIAVIFYLGYIWFGHLVYKSPTSWSLTGFSTLPVILLTLNFLTNGFGEEIAFRAYFQDRLIQRHGTWVGVTLASSSFVLVHLLIFPFSITEILAGILLAGIFGILYVRTGSIYLIGTMHAMFNLLPRLFDQWSSDLGLLVIHGLGLLILILIMGRWGLSPGVISETFRRLRITGKRFPKRIEV